MCNSKTEKQKKQHYENYDLAEMLGVESDKLVQLVRGYEKQRLSYPCAVQEKYDGCFCIAYRCYDALEGVNHTRIFSRTGKQYLSMQHLEKCFDKMFNGTDKDFIIFEAYIPNTIQSEISGACRDTVNQHSEIIAVIHDCLTAKQYYGNDNTGYNERYSDLKNMYAQYFFECIRLPNQVIAYSYQDFISFANEIFDRGGEGVVIKKLGYGYKKGKRDYGMMKYKRTITYDLEVVDVIEGDGQFKNAVGALLCRFSENRIINVGTGLTKQQRQLWWLNKKLIVGQIVEVEAMRLTSSGLLREPRFKGIRTDKVVADF